MIRKVLVAIDGSDASRRAARFASELAASTGARVLLLTVLEQPQMIPLGPLDSVGIVRTESNEDVDRVKRMLDELASQYPTGQAEERVEIGSPSEVILRQATSEAVDLIVIGRRGHGALERLMLGSVSERVIRHAAVPVTVVS